MSEFKKTIYAGNYSVLENNSESLKTLSNFDQKQVLEHLLKEKQFDLLFRIFEKSFGTMDLFELDNLDGSFIGTVFCSAPYFEKSVPNQKINTKGIKTIDLDTLSFIKSFISKIENINESIGGISLLRFSLKKNFPTEVLELLVNAGCKINEMDNNENTLIHMNLSKPYVEFLIKHGINVNQPNRIGITPLQSAIENQNIEIVKLLLENGANLFVKNKEGNSLHYVALVEKLSFEMYDFICTLGMPIFEELNTNGTTLLFDYIKPFDRYSSDLQFEYLKKILAQGANVTTQCFINGSATTALDLAISKPSSVFEIVIDHFSEDINLTDNQGNSLLHKLCAFNLYSDVEKSKELYSKVKYLLKKGADKSLRNADDKLPHELAASDNLKEKVVTLLLKS